MYSAENATIIDAIEELKHEANLFPQPQLNKLKNDQSANQTEPMSLACLEEINTIPTVFQPRKLGSQIIEENEVMSELVGAIQRQGILSIDPVLIWWSGKRWIVIDGHHRIEAAKLLNRRIKDANDHWKKNVPLTGKADRKQTQMVTQVPVRVFEGNLHEALGKTTLNNGKAQLSLGRNARLDWAWKMTVLHYAGVITEKFIANKQSAILHVSERSLRRMKKAWMTLKALHEAQGTNQASICSELSDWPWKRAKLAAERGVLDPFQSIAPDTIDAQRNKKVEQTAQKLLNSLGPKFLTTPNLAGILAEAILKLNPRFPAVACESLEWEQSIVQQTVTSLNLDNEGVFLDYVSGSMTRPIYSHIIDDYEF